MTSKVRANADKKLVGEAEVEEMITSRMDPNLIAEAMSEAAANAVTTTNETINGGSF